MAAIATFGVQDRQLTDRERWLCFSVLFFFSFTAAFNLFKASPAITYIGADLGISDANIGYIMSFYSIAVLVFAYPGMLFMQRIGVKASVLITSALMLAGSTLGLVATTAGVFLPRAR